MVEPSREECPGRGAKGVVYAFLFPVSFSILLTRGKIASFLLYVSSQFCKEEEGIENKVFLSLVVVVVLSDCKERSSYAALKIKSVRFVCNLK